MYSEDELFEGLDEPFNPLEKRDGIIIKVTETEKLPVSCIVVDATNYETSLDLMLYKLVSSVYLVSDDYSSVGINMYGSLYLLEVRSSAFPSKRDMQLCYDILRGGALRACNNHSTIVAALDEIQNKINTGEVKFEE